MFVLALLVFCVDQLIKHIVVASMRLGERIIIVPGTLDITHMENPGAAGGILGSTGSLLLILASIISLAALMWVLRSFPASFSSRVGCGLIFGGAASNLVDRLFVGAVVDYVDFRFWWVFNVADAAMIVGAAALTLSILRAYMRDR